MARSSPGFSRQKSSLSSLPLFFPLLLATLQILFLQMVSVINIFRLVTCVLLFPRSSGRSFSIKLVIWLIFQKYLVQIPRTIHLCFFDLGGFIPLGLVGIFLVCFIGWVVVSLHDLGVHVFLDSLI